MGKRLTNRRNNERHGHSHSGTYQAWLNMKQRCYTPTKPEYVHYGARGITVCDSWRNSFLAFLADMGEKPTEMTLERMDNSAGYYKGNCCWATTYDQSRNRRNNRFITINGETRCAIDWATHFGISLRTVLRRVARYGPELSQHVMHALRFERKGTAMIKNEITIQRVQRPNSPMLYRLLYGNAIIGELASYPTIEDMQTALAKFRGASATQEPARARPWIGDDDGPIGGSAA